MRKLLISLGLLGTVIVIFIFAGLMVIVTIFIAFYLDDVDFGDEYYWGGDGNFADNEVPLQYLPLYQDAADEYGLEWELLAAVHRVETIFSSINPMISSVGAEGHAQVRP